MQVDHALMIEKELCIIPKLKVTLAQLKFGTNLESLEGPVLL